MECFDSVPVVLFAAVVVFVEQSTTNMAANVVSPSNDFSNLNPRRISYVTGGLITAEIGIAKMPWKPMASVGDHVFVWPIGYSGLTGAIGGIMIRDYWFVRRRRLDLAGLFDPNGDRNYGGSGWNRCAIVALFVAIGPCVPGFLVAASGGKIDSPAVLDTLYTYAWFVTFGTGFVLYAVLMRGTVKK